MFSFLLLVGGQRVVVGLVLVGRQSAVVGLLVFGRQRWVFCLLSMRKRTGCFQRAKKSPPSPGLVYDAQ